MRSTHKLNVPIAIVIGGKVVSLNSTAFFKDIPINDKQSMITIHNLHSEIEGYVVDMDWLGSEPIFLDNLTKLVLNNRKYWSLIEDDEDRDWHGVTFDSGNDDDDPIGGGDIYA